MIHSMTAFASARGSHEGYAWTWDLRSVNAKGLDLRLRLPDWIEGLEVALRGRLSKAMARGSTTLSLRVSHEARGGTLQLNTDQLATVLAAMARVEADAATARLTLAPSTAADVLAFGGVLDSQQPDGERGDLAKILIGDFEPVLQDFLSMRAREGEALMKILAAQIDQIETLVTSAVALAEARKDSLAQALKSNLAKVLDNSEGADPQRVAQELALLAVKSDVTEETDRLNAHIAAARTLLGQGGSVGRKLDFLMQEFNRETNTLCSKSQSTELTRVGLDLKAVIEQMREQVQNVE